MRLTMLLLLLCLICFYGTVAPAKVCGRPPASDDYDIGNVQRVFEAGEQVTLSCKPGYVRVGGSPKITCTATGEWTKRTLKCEPKSCPVPSKPKNGGMEIISIVYQSVINFTCDEGYNLIGANSTECLHTGQWSHPTPECKPVTCGLPDIPKFAKIIYDRKFTGNVTEFGFSGTYACLPPMVLFGNERASCTADGTWTKPPECQYVSCPIPTTIENGFITFAVLREHSYKDRVKYGCNKNYFLDGSVETECQKTGEWSPKPVCRAPCTVDIKRGRIFYNGKKVWIEDLKPNMVLHSEYVAVYCLNREKECGYPVVTQCIDGTMKIPECYEEPNAATYAVRSGSLPSEIKMCV
ncbi:beta-2-glycoprotein 1 [Chanos chanos]|uniref:Beta-2-glycoprotein 1 n=1 Tax=Chanos chanos TaxID=29144 RepID=A0A6J2W1U0_CHACN|nr:beta-2-glycoprotein 1 [Chanos chanos]